MLHHLSMLDMVVDLYSCTIVVVLAESQPSAIVLPLSTHINIIEALLATISKI